jgi:hypothetical protein
VGFGTPFREAFREYKIQSGAIDAVLKDENHNESESMDDCHKKAVQKIDECVEAIPKGDDDDAVPKVKCNEEDILTEDVPKEYVTKEGGKYAPFLPSDIHDEAVSKGECHTC